MARRQAMSSSGKAGLQGGDRTRMATSGSEAASAAQPAADSGEKSGCGCKRERAEATAPASPVVPVFKQAMNRARPVTVKRSAGRAASLARREAMSSRGKAGVSKNGISAAQTARAGNPNLTSRELAKTLREGRSRNGSSGHKKSAPCGRVRPKAAVETGAAEDQPWKVGASETSRGQTVTGTMVGRSASVTGDEPSTCRGITGTEYLGADIFRDFCQSDPNSHAAQGQRDADLARQPRQRKHDRSRCQGDRQRTGYLQAGDRQRVHQRRAVTGLLRRVPHQGAKQGPAEPRPARARP